MFKKFLKNTSGNIITTTAIMIVPLVLSAGAALDYSQFARKKTTLQNVIDSAALAVAREIPIKSQTEIEAKVDGFLRVNLSEEQYSEIENVVVTIPVSLDKVTVAVNSSHPTALMRIAGINTLSYSPSSTVSAPIGRTEIMLVLDTTGSMRGAKIEQLKVSATDFIEELLALNIIPDKVRIGIVPFAQYVNVGTDNSNADWITIPAATANAQWQGCVGSRRAPRNLNDDDYTFKIPGVLGIPCPSAITELTADEDVLKDEINALTANSPTYMPTGLVWGQRSLSPIAPFTGGLDDRTTQKVIVLMTDGDNTRSVDLDNRKLHNRNGNDAHIQANQDTARICENIKGEGTRVFTIGFGDGITPNTLTLLENCSTDGENYYSARDGAALSQAFINIAAQISTLFVSG